MTIPFEKYLYKYCKVTFRFSGDSSRTMDYEGMIDAVLREGAEEKHHVVMNARYAGRIPIQLHTIESIEEIDDPNE